MNEGRFAFKWLASAESGEVSLRRLLPKEETVFVEVLDAVSRLIIGQSSCLTIGKRHASQVISIPGKKNIRPASILQPIPLIAGFLGTPLLDHFERLCYYHDRILKLLTE